MSQNKQLKAAVRHVAFRHDVTSVHGYVRFPLEVITWLPLMLGSSYWYATDPELG